MYIFSIFVPFWQNYYLYPENIFFSKLNILMYLLITIPTHYFYFYAYLLVYLSSQNIIQERSFN